MGSVANQRTAFVIKRYQIYTNNQYKTSGRVSYCSLNSLPPISRGHVTTSCQDGYNIRLVAMFTLKLTIHHNNSTISPVLRDFLISNRRNASQLVLLLFNSKPISVLCHMGDFGCGDGAWTPVMKMDGNKVWYSLINRCVVHNGD